MNVTRYQSSRKRCLVTIRSTIPIHSLLLRHTSSSLTVVFVTKPPELHIPILQHRTCCCRSRTDSSGHCLCAHSRTGGRGGCDGFDVSHLELLFKYLTTDVGSSSRRSHWDVRCSVPSPSRCTGHQLVPGTSLPTAVLYTARVPSSN